MMFSHVSPNMSLYEDVIGALESALVARLALNISQGGTSQRSKPNSLHSNALYGPFSQLRQFKAITKSEVVGCPGLCW